MSFSNEGAYVCGVLSDNPTSAAKLRPEHPNIFDTIANDDIELDILLIRFQNAHVFI